MEAKPSIGCVYSMPGSQIAADSRVHAVDDELGGLHKPPKLDGMDERFIAI
jgi:hypothetical protein